MEVIKLKLFNKYFVKNLLELLSKLLQKLYFPKSLCIWINDYCHHYVKIHISSYLNKAYQYVKTSKNVHKTDPHVIWIFWWQGYNKMPLIVKKCFESVSRFRGNNKVILITKYNINNYIELPKYIIYEFYNKDISITHFSDIIRFNLLDNYGGLWIDSTIYCTSKIKYNSNIYTSGGYSNPYNLFVSSKWTEFLIGGTDSKLFKFMNEFFRLYCFNNDTFIDYFLADYALEYAYDHNIGDFKNYVNKYANKNNPNLYKLQEVMNNNFNLHTFYQIKKDTNLFKLTYKKKYNNNGKTFYSKLINVDFNKKTG